MGSDAEILRDYLDRWFDCAELGEEPDPGEICIERPDLLPRLQRLVDLNDAASEALSSIRGPVPGSVATGSVPKELGDFQLVSLLGVGANGHVYLARQTSLGRFVALKVLRPEISDDARTRARFRREAEIAASLDDPHIVPIYAIGEEGGYVYIAMKWLSGPALDQVNEPLPPEEVARIGMAVARALHAAHEAGIIHRDIKPGNIMLDEGEPFLLDFGLARGRFDQTLTQAGTVPGTLPYMSPEQLHGGVSPAALDPRTDVYSLGATLYELVTGHPPFEAPDAASLIRRIVLDEPARPPHVDRDLETIILRSLDKDRERRFASADDLANDLDRYARGEPVVSRRAGPLTRATKLVKRHRKASVAIAGALAVTLGLGVVIVAREWQEMVRRDRDLELARYELVKGHLGVASVMLHSLAERHPDVSNVQDLMNLYQASRLLEDLLDEIMDRRSAIRVDDLALRVDGITRLSSFDGIPERRRTFALARALVAMMEGRPADARVILGGVDKGRDSVAMMMAAEGGVPEDLPPLVGFGPLESVFTWLALRDAHAAPEQQGAELTRDELVITGDPRARYALAIWSAEHGDDDEAVFVALNSLGVDGMYRRSVLRNLLRQSLILGRHSLGRKYRDLLLSTYDRSQWSPADAAVLAESAWRWAETQRFDELLSWALSQWPSDPDLLVQEARSLMARGSIDAAEAAVARARAAKATPGRLQDLELLELWLERQRGTGDAEFLDRARSLAEAARDPFVRVHAFVLAAEAARILGSFGDARALLDRALDGPPFASALLEMGAQAFHHAHLSGGNAASATPGAQASIQRADAAFGSLREHAERSRRSLHRLLETSHRGEMPASDGQLAYAWFYEAVLAQVLEDSSAALEAIEECLSRPENLAEDHLKFLKHLRRRVLRDSGDSGGDR
jgi:tRNA A-37 threonylcarbamoyl transferase component Bud32